MDDDVRTASTGFSATAALFSHGISGFADTEAVRSARPTPDWGSPLGFDCAKFTSGAAAVVRGGFSPAVARFSHGISGFVVEAWMSPSAAPIGTTSAFGLVCAGFSSGAFAVAAGSSTAAVLFSHGIAGFGGAEAKV